MLLKPKANPAVSVVIPVYNKGELFRKSLTSVLNQGFEDYEVIIIDDGSTDNTKEITEQFQDERIRYYYQPNGGPARARNRAIRESRGRYIAFLDADDLWYPDKMGICYKILEEAPDMALVCHKEVMKDAFGRIIRYLSCGPSAKNMFRQLLFKGNCLSASAIMVRKEALLKTGLFRENTEFFSVEDYDLWLRLSLKNKFFFLPQTLGEYIIDGRNISLDMERNLNNQIAVLKSNFKAYNEKITFDGWRINTRIAGLYLLLAKEAAKQKGPREIAFYLLKAFSQILGNEEN